MKVLNRLTDRLAAHPRILFVIDAAGALLTAFLIGIVWLKFQQYIGMPAAVLKMLAIIAFIIGLYSTGCFLLVKNSWPSFIKAIAIANGLYSVLTLCLLGIYYPVLSIIGIIYFLVEIVIISLLICLEFKVRAAVLQGQKG